MREIEFKTNHQRPGQSSKSRCGIAWYAKAAAQQEQAPEWRDAYTMKENIPTVHLAGDEKKNEPFISKWAHELNIVLRETNDQYIFERPFDIPNREMQIGTILRIHYILARMAITKKANASQGWKNC